MANSAHSVTLDSDLCTGCTNCLRRCPTEAVRVRDGKAVIIASRCIDCGECIRVCPHHAKKAVCDGMEVLDKFKYTIALPAPSLFGQFRDLDSINTLLGALLTLGFDDVFEVAVAAELLTDATKKLMADNRTKKPVIGSACPTIVRLIQIRFPDLIGNIMPLAAPVEIASYLARQRAVQKTGLAPEDIGCVFISPCPAKATYKLAPLGTDKSDIDAVIAMNDIYSILRGFMHRDWRAGSLSRAGASGLSWAASGGQALSYDEDRYVAADGIENCIRLLEAMENDRLEAEFIELSACPGGCVGGVLTVENPYVALVRLKKLRKGMVGANNHLASTGEIPPYFMWDGSVDYSPVMELDDDISVAIRKMAEIDKLTESLRGLDCGSCGAPSCRAFSEDVVQGFCPVTVCPFYIPDSVQDTPDLDGHAT